MSTITLWLNDLAIEMPGVTTCGYAAARVAEVMGFDPQEGPYHIQVKGALLPPYALVVDYDGAEVECLIIEERE